VQILRNATEVVDFRELRDKSSPTYSLVYLTSGQSVEIPANSLHRVENSPVVGESTAKFISIYSKV
jgi:hypothetical protein